MVLKSYQTSEFTNGLHLGQLDHEILLSEAVSNYAGLIKESGLIKVNGSAMNELNLDAVISAHVPDYTKIYVQNTVAENKTFADDMMQRMKEKNLLEGLSSIDQAAWVHHRLRKTDYTLDAGLTIQIDVMNLVISGDIETAEKVLGQMAPDDMSQPYHWLNQDRINWIRNEIRTFLGWPTI